MFYNSEYSYFKVDLQRDHFTLLRMFSKKNLIPASFFMPSCTLKHAVSSKINDFCQKSNSQLQRKERGSGEGDLSWHLILSSQWHLFSESHIHMLHLMFTGLSLQLCEQNPGSQGPFSILLYQYFLCFLWLICALCHVSHILVSVYLDWHGQRSWNCNMLLKLVEGLTWAAEERLHAADSLGAPFHLCRAKEMKGAVWKWS